MFKFSSQGNRFPFFYRPDTGADGGATNSTNQVTPQNATPGQANQQPAPVNIGLNQSQGENFTNIDPTKLPPELQSIYKNLQADYTKKTMEVAPWRKLGDELGISPEDVRNNLSRLRGIDENPQAAIEAFVMQNPQTFNALAQKMGPQAAFQAMGNQLFAQTQQDPLQTYRDVYEQTGDVGKLVEVIKNDMKSEFSQMLKQELQSVSQPLQALQTNQFKTALENQLGSQKEKLGKLGLTTAKIMQTIDANKMPYNVALSNPALLNAMITEAAGGLDALLNNASIQSVQTYQQDVINNHQQTAQLSPAGGVVGAVSPPPSQDPTKIKSEMRSFYDQMIAAQKT